MPAYHEMEDVHALLAGLPDPIPRRLESVREVAQGLRIEVWWVGGGVRDLLRGEPTADIDLVVEGVAAADRLAESLAAELGGRRRRHERFLTSTVELDDGAVVDVAAARSESYETAAALPRVEPAGLDRDLLRRDFTINALALRLEPPLAQLRDPVGGREDLAAGRLRVLHGASFRDDPTRILRGLRFERRFGFRFEPATEAQAREALRAGLLGLLSPDRLRNDLAPLFDSSEGLAQTLARGAELGLWAALDAGLETAVPGVGRIDGVIAAAERLDWPAGAASEPSAWRLALLLLGESLPRSARRRLAARLGLAPLERVLAIEGPDRVAGAGALLGREPEPPPHAVARALGASGAEELAAVAASGAAARRWVERYLAEMQPLRLCIRGGDLVAAGVTPGPGIRRALERALDARLDGRIGPGEELAFAIEAAAQEDR